MAAAEVVSRPQAQRIRLSVGVGHHDANHQSAERPPKRKPFTHWMKKITSFKGSDQHDGKNKSSKQKKNGHSVGQVKNNPYPASGSLPKRDPSPASSANGQLSFATPKSTVQDDGASYTSIAPRKSEEREEPDHSNRSGAPTLATQPETIHSEAGHSKAPTATTGAGALSSIDGAGGANSTFSSPNQSQQSLTTTLTTIQSASPGNALGQSSSGQPASQPHNGAGGPVMFSHQYPTSPAPLATPASAIPRHVADTMPNSYNAATANNVLTDNASILTLASSSKRRRRSMDTDASVRAIPPSSVWGGSRESLPLSVLSGNAPEPSGGAAAAAGGLYAHSHSRPSIGGLASAERASVYSSQGVTAPALASERNSSYSHKPKDLGGDAKSLRSLTGGGGGGIDARSQFDARSAYDAKSLNDARSMDLSSLKNYEGSIRSGALGHGRTDSISGSIGSPLATSPGPRQTSLSGAPALSRRSSDWQDAREEREEGIHEEEGDEGVGGSSTHHHRHEGPGSTSNA
ncbi:hypothetical protein D0864_09784 [Hortaea werneckii]|uniref:Ca2+-modulated nonselective cation channel polycystin n=1 Tax=Hortaea werneckii TaxID=91943 RepID=A0A3M7EHT3_HORWE|nr:hypothetical protein D0864_09784 [Hortaea werneckii]